VRAWADVHTKTHNHPAKGSYRPKAIVRGTLVLVQVERLPRQTRIPKRLWLWWRRPGQPDLATLPLIEARSLAFRNRHPWRPGAGLNLLPALGPPRSVS